MARIGEYDEMNTRSHSESVKYWSDKLAEANRRIHYLGFNTVDRRRKKEAIAQLNTLDRERQASDSAILVVIGGEVSQ